MEEPSHVTVSLIGIVTYPNMGAKVVDSIYSGIIQAFSMQPIRSTSMSCDSESSLPEVVRDGSHSSTFAHPGLAKGLKEFYWNEGFNRSTMPSDAEFDQMSREATYLKDRLESSEEAFGFRPRTSLNQVRIPWKVTSFWEGGQDGISVIFDSGKKNRIGLGGSKVVNQAIKFNFKDGTFEKISVSRSTPRGKKDQRAIQRELEITEKLDQRVGRQGSVIFSHFYNGRSKEKQHSSRQMRKKTSVLRHQFISPLGTNFPDWIEKSQHVPLEERKVLMLGMASELKALHSLGIAHRDIKPDNFLIQEDQSGRLSMRLIDFGLATDKETHKFCGTISYLPADVLIKYSEGAENSYSSLDQTMRGDLYALGLTFYQLLNMGKDLLPITRRLSSIEDEGVINEHGYNQLSAYSSDEIRRDYQKSIDQIYQMMADPKISTDHQKILGLVARMLCLDPAGRPSMTDVEGYLRDLSSFEIRHADFEAQVALSDSMSGSCIIC